MDRTRTPAIMTPRAERRVDDVRQPLLPVRCVDDEFIVMNPGFGDPLLRGDGVGKVTARPLAREPRVRGRASFANLACAEWLALRTPVTRV